MTWRDRVEVDAAGCWMWTGALHPDGYAIGYVPGLNVGSVAIRRVALAERLGRPIAPGMFACHTCHRRRCVNPDHLYEGTPATNGRDRAMNKEGIR